jgi:hypothetical protein
VTTGLVVGDLGFEVLADNERAGPRRLIEPADVDVLNALARRYMQVVEARSGEGVLAELGREL